MTVADPTPHLADDRRRETSLSGEQSFVRACIRRVFGLDCESQETTPPGESLDWDRTMSLISREALAPLVYAGLPSTDARVTSGGRALLRAASLVTEVRSKALVEPTFREALATLHHRGLDPIVLKGMALAHTVYPRPVYRTLADIDFLLPREQVDEARLALSRLGFGSNVEEAPTEYHLRPLYSSQGQISVELHFHLLPEASPYTISLDSFRARSTVSVVAGVEARVLAPTDLLLHSCIHLSYSHRYRWYVLRGLTDILAITTHFGNDLDWNAFLTETRRSRTVGAVYWPLWLSRSWLGAPIPDEVFSSLAVPAALVKAMEVVATPAQILDHQVPTGPGNAVLYTVILDWSLHAGCSRHEQTGAVIRSVFPASDRVGHLPPNLAHSWLGYALYLSRPSRIFRGVVALARLVWWIARNKKRADRPPREIAPEHGATTITISTEALK